MTEPYLTLAYTVLWVLYINREAGCVGKHTRAICSPDLKSLNFYLWTYIKEIAGTW